MDFNSHFSDDSAQNMVTSFEKMEIFIRCIYENNFFMNDDIICYTKYGCSKQYRCEN